MALSLDHFGRAYGSFTAVADLSFTVGSGEIVGLIGPNGAGKTTTLRSLAGILKPTSGHVTRGATSSGRPSKPSGAGIHTG